MTDIEGARRRLVSRILGERGASTAGLRRAAFEDEVQAGRLAAIVGKVARSPSHVTDDDVETLKLEGFSEDQIFELVVCAAVGKASRQLENACAALESVTEG